MHLKRTQFGEIVAEFLPPEKPSDKVVILCDGMPSMPSKKRAVQFFSKKGYWCFHPRYRGSWESGGRMFDHDPSDDIIDVIESLPNGFKSIWDGEELHVQPERTFVIGSSFGGTAALMASLSDKVDKVIAISPVVDWTAPSEDEPMDWLGQVVLKEGYGQAYRFDHSDWERLSRGEFFQPLSVLDKLDSKKIFIAHAQDDKVVMFDVVKQFVDQLGCEHVFLKKGGHNISGSLMRWPRSRKLLNFLQV